MNAISNCYFLIGSKLKAIMTLAAKSDPDLHLCAELNAEVRKFIRMGANASQQLQSLIEDILDLSKLESGIFRVNMSDFVVKALVGEVTDIFEHQCKARQIGLNIEVDDKLCSIVVNSDSGRIKQVLLNIMSNASKFTFDGSISLFVNLVKRGDRQMIEFRVVDTGIGISEDDQSKLFKLFGRLPQQNNINPNGCGIGLTVSKKFVEALGGSIDLYSKHGEGTRVTFTVPLFRVHRSGIIDVLENESNNVDQMEVGQEEKESNIITYRQ